jgi:hypothetical protein
MSQIGARAKTKFKASLLPNAWIHIDSDEPVTVDKSESGQAVMTSLSMLVAEELECDWKKIHTEFAPADKAYFNPMLGMQGTGASSSIRVSYTPMLKPVRQRARRVRTHPAAQAKLARRSSPQQPATEFSRRRISAFAACRFARKISSNSSGLELSDKFHWNVFHKSVLGRARLLPWPLRT